MEGGELAGIAAIRLHAIPRLHRDQRRGHHRARDAQRGELALDREATRPGFVAALQRAGRGAAELGGESADGRALVGHLPFDWRRVARRQDSHRDGVLVDIEAHDCATLLHDRLLSYAALTPLALTRDPR